MATRKRAPSKGSPKIRFVQIAAKAATHPTVSMGLVVLETPVFGLDAQGRVWAYDPTDLGGVWKELPRHFRFHS